ncbi:hypothetical protein [Pelagerythrobacter rhizovicinus]|nr:hypothetical protein [Pelagerythrobacter rhizovicinus]
MGNPTTKLLKLLGASFALLASSCAAAESQAISSELVEFELPIVDQERLRSSAARPDDARLRELIGEIKVLAAEGVRGFGEEPYLHTEQAGRLGDKLLVYAASPRGVVGYFIRSLEAPKRKRYWHAGLRCVLTV